MLITRHKWGKGFTYRDSRGEAVPQGPMREWLSSLVIPPAWRQVEIDTDPASKILATGRDAAGRKQYIYNEEWQQKRNKEKYARIVRFAGKLTKMRRVTGQHLIRDDLSREKVLACMVRLIDCAYFRPGSPKYVEENDSYGITTMRSRHLSIVGDELIFQYRGKAGVEQEKHVEDPHLRRVVAELDAVPGYEIFKYIDKDGNKINVESQDLNAYIREVMGEDFSAKDFRTWAGTSIAALALDELGVTSEERAAEENIRKAIAQVAERLGNTPTVARSSYVAPRVIEHYLVGNTVRHFMKGIEHELRDEMVSPEERAILKLLKYRLRKVG